MNKSNLIFTIIITLLIGVLVGIWGQSTFLPKIAPSMGGNSIDNKFEWTCELINQKYVDDVDMDSLLEVIIPELVHKLDPHSEYIPPQDLSAVNESIEGEFDGIGVVFNMATDTAIVLNVVPGGPGAKAGIEPGDRIMMVDDTLVAGIKMDQMDVVGRLRGKRGTEVDLAIKRGNTDKLLSFTLERDIIPINSIEADFMTRDSAAYVRITNFAEHTYVDAISAIDKLVKRGAKSIVIDLRANGGGLLDQSLLLANEFLKKDEGIVYVEGSSFPRREQFADGRGAFQNTPLFVLIDESSASASEIFSGAMQDNDRATIIGRRSFGKGLVQEQIPYMDGSATRITVARYYTPLGRALQKPYTMGERDSYMEEVYERFKDNEVTTGVGAKIDSTVTYTTPNGRILYGGGGISPDIFVPLDTTKLPKYFIEIFQKNAIFSYAQSFSDSHRKAINQITDVAELDAFFAGFPNLYDDFVNYATNKKEAKQPNATEKQEARSLIETQLKAYISRNTPLQESGFYYMIASVDEVITALSKAIKEID